MKRMLKFNTIFLLAFILGITSCKVDEEPLGYSYEEPEERDVPYLISAKTVDMVMIYEGGEHRSLWTPDKYDGFVSYIDPDTKEENWLFDGYLLIEVQNGLGKLYSEDGGDPTGKSPAGRKEWEWLLEKHFTKGRGIDALNTKVEEVKGRIGAPKRKRQVVYALPVPFWKQTDWGILNGKQLDFNDMADRTAAASWYIDQVLAKWKELNPANLELAGFYWIPESIYNNTAYIKIAENVGNYIKSKGDFLYYWIPYWNAVGRESWKQYGFDIAYQQPNSAFKESVDYTVDETVAYAKRNGLSMEFEFTAQAVTGHQAHTPWARERFIEYLESYEKNGIFDEYPMAHYQSQRDWGVLYESTNPADLELSKRYGRTIVERQKKADQLFSEQADK